MQQNSLFASFAAFQEWIYAICVVFLRANELKFRCVGKSVFIVSFPLFPANDKNSKNWHRNIGRMRFQIEISCFDKKQSSGFEPNCLYQMAVMSQTIIKPNWFFLAWRRLAQRFYLSSCTFFLLFYWNYSWSQNCFTAIGDLISSKQYPNGFFSRGGFSDCCCVCGLAPLFYHNILCVWQWIDWYLHFLLCT